MAGTMYTDLYLQNSLHILLTYNDKESAETIRLQSKYIYRLENKYGILVVIVQMYLFA